MASNNNALNTQIFTTVPQYSVNPISGEQQMNPIWVQYYRNLSNRVGGSSSELISGDGSGNTLKLSSGTAISIDITTDEAIINNTGVIAATAGTGIDVSSSIGAVTITNTGVISNSAGTGINVSNSTGAVTITNTGVISLSGTANEIDVSGGTGSVTISIDANYAGQSSITTLGTITTGTWHGSVMGSNFGGTGVNNSGSTITIGGNVAFSGAHTFTGTLTGNTSVTFPTSGTLLTVAVTSLAGTANEIAISASTGAVTLSMPQNVVIPTPTSGDALSVTGTNGGARAASFFGSSTSGASRGVLIEAGTTSSDFALACKNQPGTINYFVVFGDGSTEIGYNGTTNTIATNGAGNVTIAAPSSGPTLTVTGTATGTPSVTLNTTATTGSQTASFSASNKPGAATQTSPTKWIPITLDGVTYYIPAFI